MPTHEIHLLILVYNGDINTKQMATAGWQATQTPSSHTSKHSKCTFFGMQGSPALTVLSLISYLSITVSPGVIFNQNFIRP